MQLVNEYLNFENIKTKLNLILKQILTGGSNIGVFIILCIIVVATFESLGLSNREKNLEHRLIQNMDLSIDSLQNRQILNAKILGNQDLTKLNGINSSNNLLIDRIKVDSIKDIEKKNLERNRILFEGAIDQFLYENKENFENCENLKIEEKNFIFIEFSLNGNKQRNENKKTSSDEFYDF